MTPLPLNTNAAALKGLLPEYLKAIGAKPRFGGPGNLKLKANCPLHPDRHPSLTAKKEGDDWVWYCHPCEEGGTVLELHARRLKLNLKTQFPQICREVAEIVRAAPAKPPITEQPIDPPTKMNTPPIPNDELASLTLPWRKTLYEDSALWHKFARELGLPPYILYRAAHRRHDGVGIAPAGHKWTTREGTECRLNQPRLVYIGAGYYKIRSPFGDDSRPRFYTCGRPERPWLGELLVPGNTTVKDVHLHESESSALALIAAEFWSHDNGSIAVATSGSGGFKPEWVPLFAGRTVHMWPDADKAGIEFADETAALLHGTANQIIFHDWNTNSSTPIIP